MRRSHDRRRDTMRWISLLGAVLFGSTQIAVADQLRVNGLVHDGARVVAFEDGKLSFHRNDGELLSVGIDEVEFILIDRRGAFLDFNDAERLAANRDFDKAVVRYRRMIRIVDDFWSDLVQARLLVAAEKAGHIDTAAIALVRLTASSNAGPGAAARLIPRNIPQKKDALTARAVDELDQAFAAQPAEAQRVPIACLRHEILRRTGDERSSSDGARLIARTIPESVATPRVYEVVYAAMQAALSHKPTADAMGALDRAVAGCPSGMLPRFLLLKGEALSRAAQTNEDFIRASWPYLRVVVHYPDDPAAPDALYGAATILVRLGEKEKASELFRECVSHRAASAETRKQSQAQLDRLK